MRTTPVSTVLTTGQYGSDVWIETPWLRFGVAEGEICSYMVLGLLPDTRYMFCCYARYECPPGSGLHVYSLRNPDETDYFTTETLDE